MLPPRLSPDVRIRAVQEMLETTFVFLDFVRRLAAEYGLTTEQFEILFYLGTTLPRPLTFADLRERTYRQGPDLTRRVIGLETLGFVERRPLAADRRQAAIHLTRKGYAFLVQEMQGFCALVSDLAELHTEPEAEQMLDVMARIRRWSRDTHTDPTTRTRKKPMAQPFCTPFGNTPEAPARAA